MMMPLPASMDTAAAGQLRLVLKTAFERGDPLALDGSTVERVGQACLQVLAAAQRAAADAGVAFAIHAPSPALDEMVRLARLDTLLPVEA